MGKAPPENDPVGLDGADPEGSESEDCAEALLASAARMIVEYFMMKVNVALPKGEEETMVCKQNKI